jgi:NADH-quinone oxidoreductase subunit M
LGVFGAMNGFPIISVLTFAPLAAALVLIGLGPDQKRLARGISLGASLVNLILAAGLWMHFDPGSHDPQFVEQHRWFSTVENPDFVQYYVAVDGLSVLMVLLTALVVPIAILASWKIEDKVPTFFSLVLFLQSGLFGTFTALNFVHWFIFWEISLVPAFFLIKLWGGPHRSAAATQFFIYTMVGSVAMLLSFLALYYVTGTFDFFALADKGRSGAIASEMVVKIGSWQFLNRDQLPLVIFAGAFLGFAVKVPVVPFHTWLPTTYAEAPTSVTMLLTGLMSKMGVYGFLRILLPIFPDQMRMVLTPLLWLAVATIVLPACTAFAQKDLKRMFAYSSINHLGYCLLGIFALTKLTRTDSSWDLERSAVLNGVMLQMFNHGLTAPILFCFIAFLENRSGGLRGVDDFGGLRKAAPVFCGLMGIAIFASLGLPGLNGFIGEFLIFKGSFALATWATTLSVLGLLVTAVFLLTMVQRVFNGPLNGKWSGLPDLNLKERLLVAPALALMLLIGVCPQFLIGKINTTVMAMVENMKF